MRVVERSSYSFLCFNLLHLPVLFVCLVKKDLKQNKTKQKNHKRLKERFLIGRSRIKRAKTFCPVSSK